MDFTSHFSFYIYHPPMHTDTLPIYNNTCTPITPRQPDIVLRNTAELNYDGISSEEIKIMSQLQSQSHCCTQCGSNGHNSCSCLTAADVSSSDVSGIGAGEIMLFGVRVKVDPMRKSVSMNNLSQYEHPATRKSSNNNIDVSAAVAADTGYASADDAVRNQSNGSRERKRGVPWTEDEHKLFLLGLQKVGKGDWRGISRNFVKTRTPTQVASHAQKYFLRRSNLNRRRRRSSLFDITTDSVAPMPTEEQQNHEVKKSRPAVQASIQSSTFPMTVPVPVLPPVHLEDHQVNNGSMLIVHFPTPNPSTMVDLNLNQKYATNPLPVSLNLSLSFDHNQPSYQAGFNTGDGMISVA